MSELGDRREVSECLRELQQVDLVLSLVSLERRIAIIRKFVPGSQLGLQEIDGLLVEETSIVPGSFVVIFSFLTMIVDQREIPRQISVQTLRTEFISKPEGRS